MKEGWEYRIFESCLVKVPKQVQVKSKDYKKEGKYPIVSQEAELISGYWDDETIVYKHKDPVVIFGDHTKNIKYIDFNFVVGADGTHILSTKKDISPKFFYYVLKSIKLRELGYARHYKLLKEKYIPVPPLSEQQSIVSRLDAAFAKIDAMKVNAEKRLNEAKSLFQASLKKMLEPKEGWEQKKLKEFVVSITDGDHQPPPKSDDGIPFITIKDRIPQKGDVLYTVTGSFGIPVLIDFQKEFCFQRHIALIRPNIGLLSPTYLFYWILSSYATSQAEDTATGTAQRTVSLNSLRNFTIHVPHLSEQQSIVTTLDNIKSKVDRLQANYEKISQECDALKQAILRQVFE